MKLDKIRQACGLLEIGKSLEDYDEETKDWAIKNAHDLLKAFLDENTDRTPSFPLHQRLKKVEEQIKQQSPATRANLEGRFMVD